jgi:hypothetical protein
MQAWWGRLTARDSHPDEATLVGAALGVDATVDPAVAQHLADCGRCREITEHAASLFVEARAQAEREADAVFTDAALDRQRACVMRRIEQHGQPARVLPFPAPSLAWSDTGHVARRWIAAAAAAGLLVGAFAGRFVTLRHEGRPAASTTATATAISAPGGAVAAPAAAERAADEAFLVELEVAASPRIEPLQALDAMTPRINDYRREPR